MKKLLLITATLVASLSLVGCKCSKEQEPEQPSEFNTLIQSDYEMVKLANPDSLVELMEVETELSDTLTKADPNEITVSKAIEVFRVGEKVVFIDRDYEKGSFEMSEKYGQWFGDAIIFPGKTGDFAKAVKALYTSGLNLPETIFMTLRKPLDGQLREYPLYIFGSQNTHFISVDAGTYEVLPIE